MKYNDNGEYKDIYVKAFDTLPIGTEVDYDGNTAPDGWTQITNLYTNTVNDRNMTSGGGLKNITECSITAPRNGLAIIIVNATFPYNSTGSRTLNVAINGSASVPATTVRLDANTTSNNATGITTMVLANINENDIICPRAEQTSGSTLSCNFVIQLAYL